MKLKGKYKAFVNVSLSGLKFQAGKIYDIEDDELARAMIRTGHFRGVRLVAENDKIEPVIVEAKRDKSGRFVKAKTKKGRGRPKGSKNKT